MLGGVDSLFPLDLSLVESHGVPPFAEVDIVFANQKVLFGII